MQPRDRVYRVLNHELPDQVPVLIRAMSDKVSMDYLNNYEIDEADECYFWRDVTPLISMKVDAFDFSIPTKNTGMKTEDGGKIDPFGRISKKGAYTAGYITNRERMAEMPPFEMVSQDDPKNFKKLVDMAGDRIALFASLRGFFELTWEALGMHVFARAQRKDPAFIREYLDNIERYTYNCAKLCVENGLEFISLTDDMGFKNGALTHEKFYHEFIFPRYKKLVDMIHKGGAKVYLHSEGNISTLMEGIIDAGFDGVQGLTPIDGIDIGEIKNQYGDRIALLGGLSHSPLLDEYTKDQVIRDVTSVFKKAGKNGGLMIGPSAAVDRNCKVENVLTMINTIHDFKYD